MFVIYNRNLAAKVLKIIEVYKAKIAVSEDFALAETFFALAESRPTSTFRQLTNFQPQITDFKHRKTCRLMSFIQNFFMKARTISPKK